MYQCTEKKPITLEQEVQARMREMRARLGEEAYWTQVYAAGGMSKFKCKLTNECLRGRILARRAAKAMKAQFQEYTQKGVTQYGFF